MSDWRNLVALTPVVLLVIDYFALVLLEKGKVGYLLGKRKNIPLEKNTRYAVFHVLKWVAIVVPPLTRLI